MHAAPPLSDQVYSTYLTRTRPAHLAHFNSVAYACVGRMMARALDGLHAEKERCCCGELSGAHPNPRRTH